MTAPRPRGGQAIRLAGRDSAGLAGTVERWRVVGDGPAHTAKTMLLYVREIVFFASLEYACHAHPSSTHTTPTPQTVYT